MAEIIPELYQAPLIALTIMMTIGTVLFGLSKAFGDKEFYYWWTRQNFIYIMFTTVAGTVKRLLILEKDLDPVDHSFNYLNGSYFISPTVEDTEEVEEEIDGVMKKVKRKVLRITEFHHRGRSLYYHFQGVPWPHAIIPDGSLHANVKSEAIYACKDGNIRRQIESVKPGEKVTKTGLFTILLICLVIVALIFIGVSINQNNALLQQLAHLFQTGGSSTGGSSPNPPINPPGGI